MADIDIDTLLDNLKCGHELEFTWKNKKYSIHCVFPHKWFFTLVDVDITFEASSVDSLVKHIYLGDKYLLDVLPEVTDAIFY